MEPDLLPISALQHLLFCERQCALIHLERLWSENQFTAEGRILHDRVHELGLTNKPGTKVSSSLPLRSNRFRIYGVGDIVEFKLKTASATLSVENIKSIIPIEYKRGKPKRNDADRVQLCAQALCLEEMFNTAIGYGFIFYGKNRRRFEILFDPHLRTITQSAIQRLHELIATKITPTAIREPKCDHCSLLELCLPDSLRFRRGIRAWNDRLFSSLLD